MALYFPSVNFNDSTLSVHSDVPAFGLQMLLLHYRWELVTVSHALVISLVLLFIDTWQLSPFICSGIMIVQDAINIIFLFFDGGGVYDIYKLYYHLSLFAWFNISKASGLVLYPRPLLFFSSLKIEIIFFCDSLSNRWCGKDKYK